MDLGKAIYNILSENEDVAALVGTKIFPLAAPSATMFPFVVYEVYNDAPTKVKDGVSTLDSYDVRVTAYADSYNNTVRVGDKLRLALDRRTTYPYSSYPPAVSGNVRVQSINLENQYDEFDEDAGPRGVWRQTLQFQIRVVNN